ncbi:MAG: ComEC family protein, partial [Raoultella planticola]
MRLSQLAGCVVVGICPLLFLPELPTPLTVQVIIGGAILIAFYRWSPSRYLALTMLFFAWGVLSARQVLWPMQVLPGGNRQVEIQLTA